MLSTATVPSVPDVPSRKIFRPAITTLVALHQQTEALPE